MALGSSDFIWSPLFHCYDLIHDFHFLRVFMMPTFRIKSPCTKCRWIKSLHPLCECLGFIEDISIISFQQCSSFRTLLVQSLSSSQYHSQISRLSRTYSSTTAISPIRIPPSSWPKNRFLGHRDHDSRRSKSISRRSNRSIWPPQEFWHRASVQFSGPLWRAKLELLSSARPLGYYERTR